MSKRVTIQDIADALGISRNTVSKAINNTDGLADATKEKILQKAVEMGYKQFSYVSAMTNISPDSSEESKKTQFSGEIALLTTATFGNSHFASLMLDKFQKEVVQLGFTIKSHRILPINIANCVLPATFSAENVAAVICVEVFDYEYCQMICSLGLPVLFADGPAKLYGRTLDADYLLMENSQGITEFVHRMVERGYKKIGFIGDYKHCQSFYERYSAFRLAMIMENVPVDSRFIIDYKDQDIDDLTERLHSLTEMPDAFICANDFVAISAMQLLAMRDTDLIRQVRFLGFDDSQESRINNPPLSTIHIHTQTIAYSALNLLINRIREPSLDYQTLYVATDLILRESTES